MATATAPARATETISVDRERPWTMGSVWTVEFIRVKSGRDTQYGRSIADTWKKAMDEHIKGGIVLSYKVLSGLPSTRDDFTHLLMIEFPNYAALDQRDKLEAGAKKVLGSLEAMDELLRKREEIREAIGVRLLQEMRFKD
jgi:hypothetical protein